MATAFYRSHAGIIVLFFITLFFYFLNEDRVKIKKCLVNVLVVWLLYSMAVTISTRYFAPFFIFRHLVLIFTAYVLLNIFKFKFISKFEEAVTILSVISIFFWLWFIIHSSSLLYISRLINISGDMNRNSAYYYNFLFYTIESDPLSIIPRNRGFSFEPGPFAIYLAVAIYFNLMRNALRIRGNYALFILSFAILTTQSTTGIGAFLVATLYMFNQDLKGRVKYLILAGVIALSIYTFFSASFMLPKIRELYDDASSIEEVLARSSETGKAYSAGRFGGFYLALENMKSFPLFGSGGKTSLAFGKSEGSSVYAVNGIANIIISYGLFGLIIYVFLITKSSVLLSSVFGRRSKYGFLILFFLVSIGFSLHEHVLMFTFLFFGYFLKPTFRSYLIKVKRLRAYTAR